MRDSLEQLLRDADATANREGGSTSVDAVYERVAQRRNRRVAVRCAAVAAIVLASALYMMPRRRALMTMSTITPATIAPPSVTLEALNAEADRREALVDRLVKIESDTRRQIALRRRGAQPDPLDEAQQQMETAAFAMVYQANRLAETVGQDSARPVYREVVAYFPQTESAQIARQRLTP